MNDYDTEEQCNAFDEWTKLTADFYDRHRHHSGAVGYEEIEWDALMRPILLEWDAFQTGWNAAKKHFRNEEILNIKAGADINAGDGGYR